MRLLYRPSFLLLVAALSLLCLPLAGDSATDDWPGFRGPNRDGISTETGLLTAWPDGGPQQLWKVSVGGGFSGLTAASGKLFTLFSHGGRELVAALDAGSGKVLWRYDLDQERRDRFGNGPRSTPTVEGGMVYAVSALGQLVALKADKGEKVWGHDLRRTFGARIPEWGVSASPVVEGDLLLFDVGGKPGHSIVAFDKRTGEVAWSAETDIPGYALPISFSVGGVRQTVFFTGSNVVAVDPASGKTLWKKAWKTAYDVNAAAPLFIAPDKLFVSSGYDTGATLFRIAAAGGKASATEVWKTRGMKNQFSSSIYHNGYIYGFDNKNFKCIDAATGEDKWRKGGLGHGSLFYADGHLVVLSEGGELLLVKATPKAYTEVASSQVAEGKHWTVPTLYDGKLYVRNEQDLYCLKLKG
ncbi:MAG: PQQ-binding-like beta-propeller repeat protein [Acidobacteriota bacterium]